MNSTEEINMLGLATRPARWRWAMAAVFGLGGLWFGSAVGQTAPQAPTQPTRLIVQPGAEPGVYVVNGAEKPDVPPPAAAPVVPPPPLANVPPPAAFGSPTAAGCISPITPCSTGKCGHGPRCGPRAFDGVTFRESWSFHWNCFRTPATVPPPLGANVRTANDTMRSNALGEYFVVYREDWLFSTTNLNESGERHLDGIIRRLSMTASPVKVEPTGNVELDTLRKVVLTEALTKAGVPPQEATARVVIGGTRAEGLRNGSIEALYGRGATIYSSGSGGGFGGAMAPATPR